MSDFENLLSRAGWTRPAELRRAFVFRGDDQGTDDVVEIRLIGRVGIEIELRSESNFAKVWRLLGDVGDSVQSENLEKTISRWIKVLIRKGTFFSWEKRADKNRRSNCKALSNLMT